MNENWYQKKEAEILQLLQTSQEGLSDKEAASRLETYGPNKLAEAEKIGRLRLLLHQFTNPLIYILLAAALVTVFLEEYKDTGVILAAIILNALIGYTQELKAEKNVRALKKLIRPPGRSSAAAGSRKSIANGWSPVIWSY